MNRGMSTWQECLEEAGRRYAAACARQSALSPREAAEEAWRPGGPSLEQIEADIRADRAAAAS
jgi:hypothetical protein